MSSSSVPSPTAQSSPSAQLSLGLCMIVKNEAENLPRCLASVAGVVDELVVMDTGSTDETVAIAHSFGAKVPQFTWCNDFSAARNAALSHVSSDWILVLDADETLAPGIVAAMRQAMQAEQTLVINLVRQEIGATQSPYSAVSRLFRRHPALRFSRPYHAMIDDSVVQLLAQEPKWQIVDLPGVGILHNGYDAGTIASRNKWEKARTTMEGFLAQHPNDPYVCSKLGALYMQLQSVDRGMELLQRGLQAIDPEFLDPKFLDLKFLDPACPDPTAADRSIAAAPIRFELHYHLGIAYSRLQQPALAEQHYRRAIQQPILDCLKLGAYNNLGSLLHSRGDWSGAQAAYHTCLAIDPTFATAHYNLGMTLKAMGQLSAAIDQYRQALAHHPTYAAAYQNLGVALLKVGQIADGLAALQQAIHLHQAQNPQEAERLRRGLQEMGLTISPVSSGDRREITP